MVAQERENTFMIYDYIRGNQVSFDPGAREPGGGKGPSTPPTFHLNV